MQRAGQNFDPRSMIRKNMLKGPLYDFSHDNTIMGLSDIHIQERRYVPSNQYGRIDMQVLTNDKITYIYKITTSAIYEH